MCCPAVRDAESRPLLRPGEASGERLRHWGRAALELRWVRRGSARIPLRGNPGRASIGKAPEKVSQEPDSVTTRYSSNSNPEFTRYIADCYITFVANTLSNLAVAMPEISQ
ncbi:hypothetical protein NDU88_004608 [Pleurodeles waltl]|uniref:Uncharacterized protein n=1 Tax=Pleurodeles waltl TaxID=8319 RepID=A0AAV7RG72_PLEWA|nr:hypothetical protein NDU88_004608 [Pleurodeles waltl]